MSFASNNFFSDYNSDGFTTSVNSAKQYKDISLSFVHPGTGDLVRSTDVEAIKNSVKNIVLTPIGTRPFFPEFGTNVPTLLFEHFGFPTNIEIQEQIRYAIEKFEPRVRTAVVTAIPYEEQNAYDITVKFTPTFDGINTIQFILNRIR